MRKFATVSGADKTLGLRDKDGKFYIWNKAAKIKRNNIIVGDKEYAGTPELWDLIVARSRDDKICTYGDYDNYAEIMHSTIFVAAPRAGNSLSADLRGITSLVTFRRDLKRYCSGSHSVKQFSGSLGIDAHRHVFINFVKCPCNIWL